MTFHDIGITGAFQITSDQRGDERGYLMRTYCQREFSAAGIPETFVQMNHTYTKEKGTVRGMHFQHPPYAETKLIRCIRGAVFDVLIDLRSGSPTFLKWISVELSAANRNLILIPKGCAHGFQTLENDCEMLYSHSEYYTPNSEDGVRANDTRIGIEWPLLPVNISPRDQSFRLLPEDYRGIFL